MNLSEQVRSIVEVLHHTRTHTHTHTHTPQPHQHTHVRLHTNPGLNPNHYPGPNPNPCTYLVQMPSMCKHSCIRSLAIAPATKSYVVGASVSGE